MICRECNLYTIYEERCSDCDEPRFHLSKKLIQCEFCQKKICIQCAQSHPCVKKMMAYEIKKINTKMLLMPEQLKDDFVGKIVVITGRLKSMKLRHAESLVITSGGDVGSAVSRNTDFVVVGENPGSKFDRAQKLDIRILTEKEFLAMVEQKISKPIESKQPTKKRRILL